MVRKAVTVKFAVGSKRLASAVLNVSVKNIGGQVAVFTAGFCLSTVLGTCSIEVGKTLIVARLANCIVNGNPLQGVTISYNGLTRLHRLKPYRKADTSKLIQNIKFLCVINAKRRKRGEFERGKGVFLLVFLLFPSQYLTH